MVLSDYIEITGKIVKEDFFDINKPFSIESQYLTEDMIQIEYFNGRYILDIGWYNDGHEEGNFIIFIIEKFNWNYPVFKKMVMANENLLDAIKHAIKKIENLASL